MNVFVNWGLSQVTVPLLIYAPKLQESEDLSVSKIWGAKRLALFFCEHFQDIRRQIIGRRVR